MATTTAPVLVTTSRSTRVHRGTCKRVPALGAPSVLHAPAGALANATPASCCKPKDAAEYITEAAAAKRAGAESVAMYRQAQEDEAPAAAPTQPAPAAQADQQPTTAVQFSNRGISLSVWTTLGVQGAKLLAEQYDAEVASTDKATHTVHLAGPQAQQAADAIAAAWADTWSAWATYRDSGAEAYADALAINRTAARQLRRTWITDQLHAIIEERY